MGRTKKLRRGDNRPNGSLLIQSVRTRLRYQADFAIPASVSRDKQSKHYQQSFMDETANAAKTHTVIPVHLGNFSVNSRWM
ncbi:hypothetical protein [Alcanivorax sp.]|jgi:hypothetical protein|uniref:hypothetical protein n=1 Tax=Alcanivorax sp. TaxID=1872427 RepID=UPI0032D91147